MMRMTVLASGSNGNSTLVSSSRTRILVDAGLSCRELLKRMQMANEDAAAIDALLITHEHQDHVQGLSVLARKLGVPVYFTQATHRAWMRWMMPHKRLPYAAWLALRQQDLAQRQAGEAAPPAAAPEVECADDAPAGNPPADTCSLPGLEYCVGGTGFSIGDIAVTPFTIPHDAADPVGFVFEA